MPTAPAAHEGLRPALWTCPAQRDPCGTIRRPQEQKGAAVLVLASSPSLRVPSASLGVSSGTVPHSNRSHPSGCPSAGAENKGLPLGVTPGGAEEGRLQTGSPAKSVRWAELSAGQGRGRAGRCALDSPPAPSSSRQRDAGSQWPVEGVFPTPPSMLRILGGELLVSRQAVPLGRPGAGGCVARRGPARGFPGPSCGRGGPCWLRGKRRDCAGGVSARDGAGAGRTRPGEPLGVTSSQKRVTCDWLAPE